jgi:DNA-directed RNA polymerase subunit RPC12/RpoP
MDYSISDLRKFLVENFDDEDLTTLCFDYFREVYKDYTIGMRKSQKARLLLDYCQERRRMDDLLAALKRERPGQNVEDLLTTPRVEAPTELFAAEIVRNTRQVFIAHAHEDAELAHRLAGDLEEHGLQVWIAPDSIRPGEKWVEAINRGLDECGLFVLLLTKMALEAPWVRSETNVAIELEHKGKMDLVMLQVEPTEVPALWGAYQRISFQDEYEAGLAVLLARLESGEVGDPFKAALSMRKDKPEPATKPYISEKISAELAESRRAILRLLVARQTTKFECAKCGKRFDYLEDLTHHEANWHSAAYQCPKCGLPFKTKEDLDTHILNWHQAFARKQGIRPLDYKCPVCGKRFDSQEDLEKHKTSWHSSKHQCPQCGLPFKHLGDLDEHIRNWHT